MASKKKSIPEEGAVTAVAAPETRVSLVVCAYLGTEDKMRTLWQRALPDSYAFKIVPVEGDVDMRSVLTVLLADDGVAESFVCVPANTFPTSPIQPEELLLPVVYVDKRGRRQYAHRLPKSFDKKSLTELYSSSSYYDLDEEGFLKAASALVQSRPVEVGHSFGNFVTMVLRGTPCEHEVIAGLLPTSGRKYIAASYPGWHAIEHIIDDYLGRDCP